MVLCSVPLPPVAPVLGFPLHTENTPSVIHTGNGNVSSQRTKLFFPVTRIFFNGHYVMFCMQKHQKCTFCAYIKLQRKRTITAEMIITKYKFKIYIYTHSYIHAFVCYTQKPELFNRHKQRPERIEVNIYPNDNTEILLEFQKQSDLFFI